MSTTILGYAAPSAGWHHGGPGRWVLIPITFWLLVIVGAILLWRRRPWPGPESALGEAFGRGEISEQEYRSRLAVLRETRGGFWRRR
jgi:putative membrane protein